MSKSSRQITIRDDLWTRVDALAQRRGMSVDDVVQAALVQLFSKKKPEASTGSGARPMPAAPQAMAAPAPAPMPVASPSAPSPRQPTPRVAPSSSMPRAPAAGLPRPTGSRLPPPAARAVAQARPLYLHYGGQWYAIDQDQFVIGRGSKYSDLAIKDANISRRHAAVVRRNGEYFIKDLESTNGVEFNGQRVDNHRIEEGAVYRMCDHEIRFSFVPPA